jgi:hypothetical protein
MKRLGRHFKKNQFINSESCKVLTLRRRRIQEQNISFHEIFMNYFLGRERVASLGQVLPGGFVVAGLCLMEKPLVNLKAANPGSLIHVILNCQLVGPRHPLSHQPQAPSANSGDLLHKHTR